MKINQKIWIMKNYYHRGFEKGLTPIKDNKAPVLNIIMLLDEERWEITSHGKN